MERKLDIVNHVFKILTEGGIQLQNLADFLLENRDVALNLFLYADFGICEQCNKINREDGSSLSYGDFVRIYMEPNRPVIFKSGMIDDWKASKIWRKKSQSSNINIEHLRREFGHNNVDVHVQLMAGFESKKPRRIQMSVDEYITRCFKINDEGSERYYLKDWKFVVQNPDYDAYTCPIFFRDDWLNDSMKESYKFVYFGSQGTITGLHADVLSSYSWSTNVAGKKRWFLIPPEYTLCLFDIFGQTLSPHLNYTDDSIMFPGLGIARKYAIEVIQEEGETIFVPSGWYHQVENLETTISINHNWINGFNIKWSWKRISRELRRFIERNGILESPSINDSQVDSGPTSEHINGDLMLFWMMIERKVEVLIDEFDSNSIDGIKDRDCFTLEGLSVYEFNLREIRPLLKELVHLVEQGCDFGVSQQCKWSAPAMLNVIDEMISSLSAENFQANP